MASTVVNTAFLLRKMLDDISPFDHLLYPSLFLDADGRRLCRTGPLAVLELHYTTPTQSHTYLIYVHFLEDRAFSTLSTDSLFSLKSILENPAIPKVFFDVRMDADALFSQYGVALAGVIDVQLMELSVRAKRDGGSDGWLHSFARCLEHDSGFAAVEVERFESARSRGKALWDPEVGGTYDVFELKSLSSEIIAYCEAVVGALPRLFEVYNSRLDGRVRLTETDDYYACRIIEASRNRVVMAQGPPRAASSKGPWDDWNGGSRTMER